MKIGVRLFFLSIMVYMLIMGCNQNHTKSTASDLGIKYIAYRQGDTAIAVIKQSKSTFKGILEINYRGTYKDSGDVKGIIRGDTLLGDFHFQHYGLAKWNRKPIVFLRNKDQLILGQGMVTLTFGVAHFDPTIPINYDESRQFVFSPYILSSSHQ